MSTYDVTPGDEPLDVARVTADDQIVERLRSSLSPDAAVVWDDDDEVDDPAFALLRTLQRDVAFDLPEILPVEVPALLGRRRLGRGATIAAITAGVLSIGGVAAAASSPGAALSGVRSAVSSAVTQVVDAITPDAPIGPAVTPKDAGRPTPAGDAVSAAARSAAAVRQIDANLGKASHFLDRGQDGAAREQLQAAARKLPMVTEKQEHARLEARLEALQDRLAARAGDVSTDRRDDGDSESGRRDASTDKEGNEPGAERPAPPEHSDDAGGPTNPSRVSDDHSSDDAPAVDEPSRS